MIFYCTFVLLQHHNFSSSTHHTNACVPSVFFVDHGSGEHEHPILTAGHPAFSFF